MPVDRDVAHLALMTRDEFLRLDEHTARTAAGVEHAALIGFHNLDKEFNDAARRIELSALLTFGKGELAEEVLEYMAENIGAPGFRVTESDIGNKINKAAKACGIKITAGIYLGENILEGRIVLFDGIHGIVDFLTDGGKLCLGLKV